MGHVLNSGTRLLDIVTENIQHHGIDYYTYRGEEGRQFLLNRTHGYPELQTMLLISKKGQLIVGASLPYPVPDLNYSDRDYFLRHKAGENLVIGEQLMSRSHGRRGTTISKAIRSSTGYLEGIALITVESAHLERLLDSSQRDNTQEIMILRNDGGIFVSRPELAVGRRFPQAEVLTRMANAASGTFEGPSMLDGKPRYFSYETIKGSPLVVLTSQSRDQVLSSWRKFSTFVISSLFLALGLLAAASIYALKSASRTMALQFELERMAKTDSLTGLANRRHFLEQADKEMARTSRYGGAISVLMVDVDHFKAINDTYGHGTGDTALRHLADLFRLELRDIDIIGRLGGEEFAIVVSQADREQALEVAERLRKSIEETGIGVRQGFPLHLTVSIGVTSQEGAGNDMRTLLREADHALYEAKRAGRNRVSCIKEKTSKT